MEAVGWIVAVPPPRYVSKRGHLGELGFSESEQAQLSASERQNQGDFGWLFERSRMRKRKKFGRNMQHHGRLTEFYFC